MILEKEDWEEPECCFRPHIAAAEAVHTGSADGGPSVREVIQGFDRLLDRDAKREAAIYLEDWMARYEEAGDWASQITILNEMMGFYRNSGEREKGLAAVEKGLALVGDHGLSQTVTGGTTCLNAATTMKAFGKAAEAMPYYDQAFRAYGGSLPPGDYRSEACSTTWPWPGRTWESIERRRHIIRKPWISWRRCGREASWRSRSPG